MRHRLRREKDFAGADALRDRLREGGWEVKDSPDGFSLHPLDRAPTPRAVTLGAIVHGWPEDARRWLDSVHAHTKGDYEACLLVNGEVDLDYARETRPERTRAAHHPEGLGWAEAANLLVGEAAGAVVILFDPGVELTGDVAGPLLEALEDDSVAVAGAFGVRCAEGELGHFHESRGPEVDAVEGYCLAFRREQALACGGFDARFRFYRIADFDFSFRMRERYGRAVVLPDLPLVKHEHRLWESLPEAEREKLSKKNFYRFMDRWRGHEELLLERKR